MLDPPPPLYVHYAVVHSLPSRPPAHFCSKCVDTYKQALVVTCDNVGSRQMQDIRISLRGTAVMVMGKNVSVFGSRLSLLDTHVVPGQPTHSL